MSTENKFDHWLEGLPDVFTRLASLHPKKIDLSLGRIRRLLADLDHPERKLPPIIHVAGTNGKGSVIAFLAALMKVSGYCAHIYTSPHLISFNERIVVAGTPISDDSMVKMVMRIEAANQNQPLSFFEAMTAAAFLAFSETHADFCLLETGLGGRLDATNIIQQPELTIITPIAYDHQAFLGETLAAIAYEKAGIIKAKRPVIVAKQKKPALEVVKAQAQKMQSPFFYQNEAWQITQHQNYFHYRDDVLESDLPLPCLQGIHQLTNVSLALFAFNHLDLPLKLSQEKITQALEKTQWRARLEKINLCGREVFLDGGHNPAAAKVLAHFLATEKQGRKAYLICAMRRVKSAKGFLAPFARLIEKLYTVDLPTHQQIIGEGAAGYQAAELAQYARNLNIPAEPALNVQDALTKIPFQIQKTSPLILIAGSLLLAGDVLKDL